MKEIWIKNVKTGTTFPYSELDKNSLNYYKKNKDYKVIDKKSKNESKSKRRRSIS